MRKIQNIIEFQLHEFDSTNGRTFFLLQKLQFAILLCEKFSKNEWNRWKNSFTNYSFLYLNLVDFIFIFHHISSHHSSKKEIFQPKKSIFSVFVVLCSLMPIKRSFLLCISSRWGWDYTRNLLTNYMKIVS